MFWHERDYYVYKVLLSGTKLTTDRWKVEYYPAVCRNSSFGIATGCSGVRIPAGSRGYYSVQNVKTSNRAFYLMAQRRGRGFSHLPHLAPRLRMSRALPLPQIQSSVSGDNSEYCNEQDTHLNPERISGASRHVAIYHHALCALLRLNFLHFYSPFSRKYAAVCALA